MTVNKALSELAQADFIERRRRAGSFVRRPTFLRAVDLASKQHYREMAAHYRRLLVEHLDYQEQRATGGLNIWRTRWYPLVC
jgi:DNA-binding GntR family transcriptional regulator